MRITSGGNVLINTTTDLGSNLNVNSTVRIGVTFGNEASVLFGDSGTAYWKIGRPAGSGNLKISSYALDAIEIQPTTGYVGIGTQLIGTGPQRKLDIVGDHNTATFRVYYPDINVAGQDASIDIWASEPGVSYNGSGIGANVNKSPYYGRTNSALGQAFIRFVDGNMMFNTNTSDAIYSERMKITSNGYVGIGTGNPIYKLTISDPGAAGNSSAIGLVSTFNNSLNRNWSIGLNVHQYGDFSIRTGSSQNSNPDTTRLIIDNAGNVGIGQSSPTKLLSLKRGGTCGIELNDSLAVTDIKSVGGRFTIDTPSQAYIDIASSHQLYVDALSVGVHTAAPDPSAALDVTSTTQGFLPPRMSDTEMNSIAAPAAGLIVWNYDSGTLYVFDGGSWRKIAYA
jgi:hypothetical protein